MAMIGYLGKDPDDGVSFIVSREVFRTPANMKWGGSARYATHERHATHALTEFTGLDPDYFSFDMLLTVNANQKMSIFAGMECHFSPVSIWWVCSLDYPLLAGLKPVKS